MTTLTQARLKELFDYNAETGAFVRRLAVPRAPKVGSIAGYLNDEGYVVMTVDGKKYKAHRLAWLYVYGSFPTADIDHIDGLRANNSIANLRDVASAENLQNQRTAHANSLSGHLGVTQRGNHWRARIQHQGKEKHLGIFPTAESASAAYVQAKRQLHAFSTI